MVDLGFCELPFLLRNRNFKTSCYEVVYVARRWFKGIADSKSLTILLGNNDKVFHYYGIDAEAIKGEKIAPTSFNEITGIKSHQAKTNELEKSNA